jgi:hypothetical protein
MESIIQKDLAFLLVFLFFVVVAIPIILIESFFWFPKKFVELIKDFWIRWEEFKLK